MFKKIKTAVKNVVQKVKTSVKNWIWKTATTVKNHFRKYGALYVVVLVVVLYLALVVFIIRKVKAATLLEKKAMQYISENHPELSDAFDVALDTVGSYFDKVSETVELIKDGAVLA